MGMEIDRDWRKRCNSRKGKIKKLVFFNFVIYKIKKDYYKNKSNLL